MDGGFDPDNAYQFTASSQDIQITGANTILLELTLSTNMITIYIGITVEALGRALPSFL